MALRLIEDEHEIQVGGDPRDPELYRAGLSSARAALRAGRAGAVRGRGRHVDGDPADCEAEALPVLVRAGDAADPATEPAGTRLTGPVSEPDAATDPAATERAIDPTAPDPIAPDPIAPDPIVPARGGDD